MAGELDFHVRRRSGQPLRLFDEADLEAAIAKFDQLGQPARRLENARRAYSKTNGRIFAARDWDALAEIVADNYSGIDHRRVVNAENQYGRDAVVKDLQAAADVGFTISMVSAIGDPRRASRPRTGSRLRPRPRRDPKRALNVIEIDTDDRIRGGRYVRPRRHRRGDRGARRPVPRWGSRRLRAHVVVVAAAYAGFNRRENLATTPDWVKH